MSFKKYRPWNPDQLYLLPPAIRDWLEQDHLVYRLMDVLDISSITHTIHGKETRARSPTLNYRPRTSSTRPPVTDVGPFLGCACASI